MEIHELNTKALTDPAYVPFDDGTDTYKTEFNDVVESAANAAVAAADLTNNSVTFTSGDAASPTAWTSVSVITTGSTLATLFNRISTMVKNVRWLYSKLGTTDISSIGNGTVTGALSTLNGNTGNIKMKRVSKQVAIADGSTSSPTTTTIDVSGDIGAGHAIVGVVATIGAYTLPYASTNGTMQTWLYRLPATGTEIVIENTTTGWGTQTVYLLLLFI